MAEPSPSPLLPFFGCLSLSSSLELIFNLVSTFTDMKDLEVLCFYLRI